MKPTFVTLALAGTLLAGTAFAQTETTIAPADSSAMPGAFGGDWSRTLGEALFADGGTTLRSSTEISTQWSTLSEEDKLMIRRDCMAHMQTTGQTSPDADSDSAQTGTTSSVDGGMSMNVTTEQMDQICAATKDL